MTFRKPALFQQFTELVAAESTRHGGVSVAPYDSLNLGINTDDLPENVAENRRLFFDELEISEQQFASAYQVHGEEILIVEEPGRYEGYDAFITNQAGIFVGVTVADCTPILIYDAQNQAVAAIHAGWRGTVAQLVAKTLKAMQQQFGTRPEGCYAYVGTCIDACSFEVGEEVATQFSDEFKQLNPTRDKYLVNLKAANLSQLVAFGIPQNQIETSAYSTVLNNADYFSYRHEMAKRRGRPCGRMLAVIGVKNH